MDLRRTVCEVFGARWAPLHVFLCPKTAVFDRFWRILPFREHIYSDAGTFVGTEGRGVSVVMPHSSPMIGVQFRHVLATSLATIGIRLSRTLALCVHRHLELIWGPSSNGPKKLRKHLWAEISDSNRNMTLISVRL